MGSCSSAMRGVVVPRSTASCGTLSTRRLFATYWRPNTIGRCGYRFQIKHFAHRLFSEQRCCLRGLWNSILKLLIFGVDSTIIACGQVFRFEHGSYSPFLPHKSDERFGRPIMPGSLGRQFIKGGLKESMRGPANNVDRRFETREIWMG